MKTFVVVIAAAALVVGACAAEQEAQWTPPAETPAPAEATPDPADATPDPAAEETPEPADEETPEPAEETPEAAETTPDPGDETEGTPEPAAEGTPAAAEDSVAPAVAVLDHAGLLTVLQSGRCEWTAAEQPATEQPATEQPATEGVSQPGEGSTLQVTFDEEAQQAEGISVELSMELRRGATEAENDQTDTDASPAPGDSPEVEHVLPFSLLAEHVQMSVQLPGQEAAAEPEFVAGTIAPNGLSGYVVATTEQGEQLTFNFVCGPGQVAGADDAPANGEESPEPATEATPEPSP